MAQSQFSLLWNAHKRNICNGLSALQQNGEFVDMTLAADGHLVKVHQVIIALASPYIKELISTAQCPHPVIFLNKISYSTLCALLEYVYTGEVLVNIENLNELIQAGRDLHIKGLEDMNLNESMTLRQETCRNEALSDNHIDKYDEEFVITNAASDDGEKYVIEHLSEAEHLMLGTNPDHTYDQTNEDDPMSDENKTNADVTTNPSDANRNLTVLQYTVSNQGSLQMILNRYVYYLKHSNLNNTRQWRCVDYLNNIKCPALVVTKNDIVVQRTQAHIHPFHDKKILKKVKAGAVFSAIHEAEEQTGKCNKKTKHSDSDVN